MSRPGDLGDQSDARPLRIIGHRGARGYAPENTLGSIETAIAMGVDWVEIDVQLCRSGEVVVMHDLTLDRTTNGSGRVDSMTLTELQQLDAGNGERIPTLAEVLDCCRGRAGLNVEIKFGAAAQQTARVLADAVDTGAWRAGALLVSSFDHAALRVVAQHAPNLPLAALVYGVPHDLAACAEALGAVALNVSVDHLHPALIADARQRGVAVYAYTANEPDQIAGVDLDGIFTDFPDRFIASPDDNRAQNRKDS